MHPVRNKQGRTVAVIGADISLDWLKDKLKEDDWKIFAQQWGRHSKETSERRIKKRMPISMLVSKKGRFIVHPDEKRIIRDSIGSIVKSSEDTVLIKKVQHILEGKASADIYEEEDYYDYSCEGFDGRDGYLFYKPVKYTGWSLVMFTPARSIDLIAYVIGGCMTFFVLLALLIVWLVSRFSIRRSVKPLKQLASSADEVAKGNFEAPLPDIKHNDEIKNLRDSFEDMQHSLTKYMSELQTTTASKAAIENELKVAHDIQMSMLPKIFPPFPERNDIDIYGMVTPAKDVGGDLFDFFIIDEKLFFCIGDVSGKGVPASLVMAVTRSLFRNVAAQTLRQAQGPHQIVTALNEALVDGNETNMFVTLFVGILDLTNGQMRYCNAGHDAPMLVGHGVGLVPCDANLPLGVMPGYQYSLQELTIEHETTIFLFTDGLNEAEDINHVQFGIQRVLDLAGQLLSEGKHQPKNIIEKMGEALQDFVGEAEQSDDLTMLAIQYVENNGK
jgi:sigma-B regulation protein RsbU (phosphoserine phosphatase)